MDLVCTRGACRGISGSPYPKELYLAQPDRTFRKIAGAWGADDPHGRGRGVLALDFDNDGDRDLLALTEQSSRFPSEGNHLFRNTGGRFVDVTSTPLRQTITAMNAVAIPKASGYPDVALETEEGVIYHKNNGGTFAAGTRIGGSNTFDVDLADINSDGKRDLVIVRPTSVEVRFNDGNHNFPRVNYSHPLSQGRDVALCQLDGEAGIDMYVAQGRPATRTSSC